MRPNYAVALDVPLSPEVVEELRGEAWGVKIGIPLLLRVGVANTRELVRGWENVICDLKLADVESTMVSTVEALGGLCGGVIAHALVGRDGALDGLKRSLEENKVSLYLLVSMSHKGWDDSTLEAALKVAEAVDPEGLVGPATRPWVLRRVREAFPHKLILSPGVGAQGASPGDGLCAGADVEIVGRTIYTSPDPVEALRKIKTYAQEKLMSCEGTAP
ncbi:orotidine 5'-phosphate decarboxylase [Sulfodiicoccus acidiphilus]|uniref:Orotidine 5'-phosphate decarboxylase n=1 Tax=Sulfodiicoccus acidiphilus TaxID=1670455 RepID=A0A348B1A9_9CREN|nr:orotidine-5'-phosphate decarboxylase [Sulfodiicoccus acidiphilus]BBD71961.1 orotidine 5'-phosphate decarboxylase [Sulfodiicoccus acidiphilus]GGT91782.1 orotidine 5'-phosphate decarboxylase [Sulfodiicoccus acidiphilus]